MFCRMMLNTKPKIITLAKSQADKQNSFLHLEQRVFQA